MANDMPDVVKRAFQRDKFTINKVEELEKMLGAVYTGEYLAGHQEASIVRFKKDDQLLVAKFSPVGKNSSSDDIEDNISGYEKIAEIGASGIIPEYLQKFNVQGNVALVMSDLGKNFRHTSTRVSDYQNMGCSFIQAVKNALIADKDKNCITPSMLEIKRYMSQYLTQLSTIMDASTMRNLNDWEPDMEFDFASLMLLDFTPDNVFMQINKISFIDPWKQTSYLGHPAVSLGQFSTLAHDVYDLPNSKKGKEILQELAIVECSKILKCSEIVSLHAFNAGSILQYILSAYVRREKDKARAGEFLCAANGLAQNSVLK